MGDHDTEEEKHKGDGHEPGGPRGPLVDPAKMGGKHSKDDKDEKDGK